MGSAASTLIVHEEKLSTGPSTLIEDAAVALFDLGNGVGSTFHDFTLDPNHLHFDQYTQTMIKVGASVSKMGKNILTLI